MNFLQLMRFLGVASVLLFALPVSADQEAVPSLEWCRYPLKVQEVGDKVYCCYTDPDGTRSCYDQRPEARCSPDGARRVLNSFTTSIRSCYGSSCSGDVAIAEEDFRSSSVHQICKDGMWHRECSESTSLTYSCDLEVELCPLCFTYYSVLAPVLTPNFEIMNDCHERENGRSSDAGTNGLSSYIEERFVEVLLEEETRHLIKESESAMDSTSEARFEKACGDVVVD